MSRYWSDPANDPPLWLAMSCVFGPLVLVLGLAGLVLWVCFR